MKNNELTPPGAETNKAGETETKIASSPRPYCPLCGALGIELHRDLPDSLFGTPGLWGFRSCPDPTCGMVWLDPVPLPTELYKAYSSYYTHLDSVSESAPSGWFRARLVGLYGHLVHYSGLLAARKGMLLRRLSDRAPGRLLEIGCGDGSFLRLAKESGWDVTGVDSDPEAARTAEARYGIKVHTGLFEDCVFPPDCFDVVVMNHVIEHVIDPISFLARCRRVLQRTGVLLVVTQNHSGLGSRCFGPNWFGLDPPRHLHLFSPQAMRLTLRRAGFEDGVLETVSVNAEAICAGSMRGIWRQPLPPLRLLLFCWLYQFYSLARNVVLPEGGEEILAVCRRGNTAGPEDGVDA